LTKSWFIADGKRKDITREIQLHPADLGVLDDCDDDLTELVGVFDEVRNVLDEKRYLVVVLQNIRQPDGAMRPVGWEFALRMRDAWQWQQVYVEEYVWCQNQKPLGCWGYPMGKSEHLRLQRAPPLLSGVSATIAAGNGTPSATEARLLSKAGLLLSAVAVSQ